MTVFRRCSECNLEIVVEWPVWMTNPDLLGWTCRRKEAKTHDDALAIYLGLLLGLGALITLIKLIWDVV